MSENLSDSDNSLNKLYDEAWKAFTPTKEEQEKILPNQDLIKLCKKFQCKVQMNRWNPLFDFYRYYEKKGKLNNKTAREINKLLGKTVNRYKSNPKYIYSQEEIEECHHAEWRSRKLWNILWLEGNESHCDESADPSSEFSKVTITESESLIEEDSDDRISNSNHLFDRLSNAADARDQSSDCSKITIIESNSLMEKDSDAVIPNSNNSLDRLYNEADICCNTESLTVGTEDILQSNSEKNIDEESQNILFPQNSETYSEFHRTIPITSTQSQGTDI